MAMMVIFSKLLPVIMLTSSSSGRVEVLLWLITFTTSTPGAGMTPTRRNSTSIINDRYSLRVQDKHITDIGTVLHSAGLEIDAPAEEAHGAGDDDGEQEEGGESHSR